MSMFRRQIDTRDPYFEWISVYSLKYFRKDFTTMVKCILNKSFTQIAAFARLGSRPKFSFRFRS